MPDNLVFKSNQDAFDYCCKYMALPLTEGSRVYGLITDIEEEEHEGEKNVWHSVKLASDAGIELHYGLEMYTTVAKNCGLDVTPIQVGDLVAVEITNYDAENIYNSIWLILSRVKPSWSMKHDAFWPDLPGPVPEGF